MYLTAAQIGFFLLTLIFYGLFYREVLIALPKTSFSASEQKKINRNFLILVLGWFALVYAWSRFGGFKNFEWFPYNVAPVMLIPLVAVLVFALSKKAKEIIHHIPQESLIKLQSFRFYTEVLLWALFASGLLPVQMTFEGQNFDIITGVTAVLLTTRFGGFILLNKLPRAAVILWNILGLGLTTNLLLVTLFSMPVPLRYFMNEPASTLITVFPISLWPAFLFPLACILHILSIRKA